MWPRRSYVLAPLTEASSILKDRKILCYDALESSFKKLKCMVSPETLLSDLECKLPLTFHTDDYDKQLCAVISKNNKPIAFSI